MTRRRYVPPPGYRASTKGHSVLKKWAYGGRPAAVDYEDTYVARYVPTLVPLHSHYDSGREETDISRHVDSEIVFSSNLMDDVYDTAKRSHNKDAALLREATNAVVDSETYVDPRAIVASRRAARGYYYPDPPKYIYAPPPPPTPIPRPRTSSRRLDKEVVVLVSPYRLRSASVSSYYARVLTKMAMAGRVSLADIHPPPVTRTDLDRDMEQRRAVIHALGRPTMLPYYRPYYSKYPWYHGYYRYRYPYFRLSSEPTRVRVLASPLPHKRSRGYRIKAALVGSKVDVVVPKGRGRRLRSQYAQSVMREIKKQEIAKEEVPQVQVTAGLKAHPRVPKGPVTPTLEEFRAPVSDVRRRVRRVICKNRNDPKWFK